MRRAASPVALVALVAALAVLYGCSDGGDDGTGSRTRVSAAIDGDTFKVVVDGVDERVRLIGIDAPEAGECMSEQATDALSEMIKSGVTLVSDSSDRDQFGRLLRYVESEGSFVNEELVRRGLALARAYPPDTGRQSELAAAQAEAESEQRGLWSPDACGPATGSILDISKINADPPGNDVERLNDEWVEITNRSSETLDLSGWIVRDESASHRFTFAEGFALADGATVRLHTGCGEASATDLYWCNQGSAVWNNDGDTVFVLDRNGNIVVSAKY